MPVFCSPAADVFCSFTKLLTMIFVMFFFCEIKLLVTDSACRTEMSTLYGDKTLSLSILTSCVLFLIANWCQTMPWNQLHNKSFILLKLVIILESTYLQQGHYLYSMQLVMQSLPLILTILPAGMELDKSAFFLSVLSFDMFSTCLKLYLCNEIEI